MYVFFKLSIDRSKLVLFLLDIPDAAFALSTTRGEVPGNASRSSIRMALYSECTLTTVADRLFGPRPLLHAECSIKSNQNENKKAAKWIGCRLCFRWFKWRISCIWRTCANPSKALYCIGPLPLHHHHHHHHHHHRWFAEFATGQLNGIRTHG